MKKPLISIIVPVYNTAPWLKRCLDSICSQNYGNLEILCINDGSTDNSAEILEEYAAKDARIKLFTQANAGLSAARNTGLEHATGEWVTGVDSDDYLYPDIYKNAVTHCRDGIDLVFFGVERVDEHGHKLPQDPYFKLPQAGEYHLTPDLAGQLNVCFWSKLWRRSLIEEQSLRFPVGLVHEDEAMYCIACPYIRNVAICSSVGYAYMQRKGSIMNKASINTIKHKKQVFCMLKYVHTEYKKRVLIRLPSITYLTNLFVGSCTYGITKDNYQIIRPLIVDIIEKCDMKYADYRLERHFFIEKQGIITIRRSQNVKFYCIAGLPIWIKLYTNHKGKKISLAVILFHLHAFFAKLCKKALRASTRYINSRE